MRVHQQSAYLLQAKPWSETSLLVDVFTQEHGRLRLMAKGARRQKTGQNGYLQAFQPLLISWSGKRGLATLTGVEIKKPLPRLRGEYLASAYYMSELLFKFLHQFDAHDALFTAYHQAIIALGSVQNTAQSSSQNMSDSIPQNISGILRCFECELLSEVGYGLQLAFDAEDGAVIDGQQRYHYYPEKGPVRIKAANKRDESALNVAGETLMALARRQFDNEYVQTESKALLRALLTRQISEGDFRTRKIYAQMLQLKVDSADKLPGNLPGKLQDSEKPTINQNGK